MTDIIDIFLGEPPARIKKWIVEHYAPGPGPAPEYHKDTWIWLEGEDEPRVIEHPELGAELT